MVARTARLIRGVFGSRIARSILRRLTEGGKLDRLLAKFAGVGELGSLRDLPDYILLSSLLYVGALTTGAGIGGLDDFREYARIPAVRRGLANVLEGIATYGVTVPQKLAAPFLVVWNFTNACNLKCIHCYQRADKPTPDELKLEEKLRVVEELDEAGVASIAFSGGEPLVHPDFWPVAKDAYERGMYLAVATNGTLITKSVAEKLKRVGVMYVEVSLDSPIPEVHDKFRGIEGAWQRTVEGIKNCVEAGLTTGIAATLTKLNWTTAIEMVDLAEKLGAKRVIFFNFIPVGRGREAVEIDLTPEERERVLRALCKEALKREIEVLTTAPQYARVAIQCTRGRYVAPTHFASVSSFDRKVIELAEFIGGCGCGRSYVAIQPNGLVTPCVFMPNLVVGDLRTQRFEEVWKKSPVLEALRDRERLKGPCATCPYKYVCGGCRARALAYFGDPLAPDPGCVYCSREYYRLLEREMPSILTDGS